LCSTHLVLLSSMDERLHFVRSQNVCGLPLEAAT